MNIYEDEELERKLEKITDEMGSFILDVILVSLKKINSESVIFQEFNELKTDAAIKDIPVATQMEPF